MFPCDTLNGQIASELTWWFLVAGLGTMLGWFLRMLFEPERQK